MATTTAEADYARHDYAGALAALTTRASHEPPTADLAYDLGITHLANGETSSAIADLLVAKQLAPRDREITSALTSARTAAESVSHAPAPLPITQRELSGATLLVVIALALALASRAVSRAVTWSLGAVATCLVIVLSAIAFTGADYVVVSSPTATTHAANDATSLERFRPHIGDELELVEARPDDWLLVRGPDGTRAYIAGSAVVRPGVAR